MGLARPQTKAAQTATRTPKSEQTAPNGANGLTLADALGWRREAC
jgi:hypothetical protein